MKCVSLLAYAEANSNPWGLKIAQHAVLNIVCRSEEIIQNFVCGNIVSRNLLKFFPLVNSTSVAAALANLGMAILKIEALALLSHIQETDCYEIQYHYMEEMELDHVEFSGNREL